MIVNAPVKSRRPAPNSNGAPPSWASGRPTQRGGWPNPRGNRRRTKSRARWASSSTCSGSGDARPRRGTSADVSRRRHERRLLPFQERHAGRAVRPAPLQTLAEMGRRALAAGWGPRRKEQLKRYLRRHIVQESSPTLCRVWAEVSDNGRRRGRPIAAADAWVAATALQLGVPPVTHNRDDFAFVPGLTLISGQTP